MPRSRSRGTVPTEFGRPGTVPLYEHLIRTGAWWDLVDVLAADRIGLVLHRHAHELAPLMRAWAVDDDPWIRRTAILSQLTFREDTDTALLRDCIEPNLDDPSFWIRKAIGWACGSTRAPTRTGCATPWPAMANGCLACPGERRSNTSEDLPALGLTCTPGYAAPVPDTPDALDPLPGRRGAAHHAGAGRAAFDEEAAEQLLDCCLLDMGVEDGLREVVMPLMRSVGDDWAAGVLTVAQEHFATQVVRARLTSLSRGWSRGGPVAWLACPPAGSTTCRCSRSGSPCTAAAGASASSARTHRSTT